MLRKINIDSRKYECEVSGGSGNYNVTVGSSIFSVSIASNEEGYKIRINDKSIDIFMNKEAVQKIISGQTAGITYGEREFSVYSDKPEQANTGEIKSDANHDAGTVTSIMPGTIVKILVSEGERVSKGTVVLVLEAMKMENEIRSPVDGIIKEIRVAAHQAVMKNAVLFSVGK
jgi:biotin carboxyl carrier protein